MEDILIQEVLFKVVLLASDATSTTQPSCALVWLGLAPLRLEAFFM